MELTERLGERESDRQAALAGQLIDRVVATRRAGNRRPDQRAPGFASFAFPGSRTDLLLTVLDGLGVAASGGSACSSGAATPSHVLLAMGLPAELAASALRCTVGRDTSEADVDAGATAISRAVRQVRGTSAAA